MIQAEIALLEKSAFRSSSAVTYDAVRAASHAGPLQGLTTIFSFTIAKNFKNIQNIAYLICLSLELAKVLEAPVLM